MLNDALEYSRLRFFWCIEFQTVGQFVEYFMTVYSGKPALADLIVVHAGLQGVMLECSHMEANEALKAEFRAQGMLCRRNLETLLASLPFSLPCTLDYVLALYMAVRDLSIEKMCQVLTRHSRHTILTNAGYPWHGTASPPPPRCARHSASTGISSQSQKGEK